MMLSRRTPRATPAASWKPSSSGPRCRIRAAISRTMSGPAAPAPPTPTIPHMSGGPVAVGPQAPAEAAGQRLLQPARQPRADPGNHPVQDAVEVGAEHADTRVGG